MAVIGAAFTLAYIWRFWSGVFLGTVRREAHQVSFALVAPVVVLGALVLLGGFVVGPFEHLAEAAAMNMLNEAAQVELAYHLDARPANILALTTYALGVGLIVLRPVWGGVVHGIARIGERIE
jgi:multicomponent Na+:H+ antiporter subunit A